MRFWITETDDRAKAVEFQNVDVKELVPVFEDLDEALPDDLKLRYGLRFDPEAAKRFYENEAKKRRANNPG